jgi:hypothetical protein
VNDISRPTLLRLFQLRLKTCCIFFALLVPYEEGILKWVSFFVIVARIPWRIILNAKHILRCLEVLELQSRFFQTPINDRQRDMASSDGAYHRPRNYAFSSSLSPSQSWLVLQNSFKMPSRWMLNRSLFGINARKQCLRGNINALCPMQR